MSVGTASTSRANDDRPAAPPPLLDAPRRWDCLLIAVTWLAIGAILRPFQATPFIDDWVYAWPVEQMFLGRPFRVIDYSSTLNVVQALWGALFCLPTGFSFAALRVSTWVAALVCLWSLYLLLRQLEIDRHAALLGVATLAVYPVFFVLSISFMTDIPFLACMLAAILAFHRAVSVRGDAWLWAATVLAALSMGIRLTGVALPLAMAVVLLVSTGSWGRRHLRALVPLAAFAALGAMVAWRLQHTEYIADLALIPNAPENRLRYAQLHGLELLPQMLVGDVTFVAATVGPAVLPLVVGCVRRRHLVGSAAIFAVLWLCVGLEALIGWPHHPSLVSGATWALEELGATEPLVPNYVAFAPPPWVTWGVTGMTFACGALLGGMVLRRPRSVALALLAWIALITALLLAALWLLYDRYALPVVPLVIVYLLAREPLRRASCAIAVLALFGVYSVVGVRDHLRYNAVVWQAVDDLRRSGVPAAQIDAGYVVNGWLQYAHPEHAARDSSGAVAVPLVNVRGTLRYQISNAPVAGSAVIATLPYARWFGRSGAIHVVDHSRPVP